MVIFPELRVLVVELGVSTLVTESLLVSGVPVHPVTSTVLTDTSTTDTRTMTQGQQTIRQSLADN
jgi:hypothetical protein